MDSLTYSKPERNICKKICVIILFLCAFISLYDFLLCPARQGIFNIYDISTFLSYIVSAIILLVDWEYRTKYKILNCFSFICCIGPFYYLYVYIKQSPNYEMFWNTYLVEYLIFMLSLYALLTSFLYSDYDKCIIFYTNKYWTKKKLIAKDETEKRNYWEKRFKISYIATLCWQVCFIIWLLALPNDFDLLFKNSRTIKILPLLLLAFTILIKFHSNKKGWKFFVGTRTKSSYISSLIALLMSVICFILPLYTNLLTISSSLSEQKYSIRGTDIVEGIGDTFEAFEELSEEPEFSDFLDALLDNATELIHIDITDYVDEDELIKNLTLLFLSIISGITLIIIALIWLIRAINEFRGKYLYSSSQAIGTIVVQILFCFSLTMLANTWTEYFQDFYIIIDISTGTIPYTILAVILSASYLFVNNKEMRETINNNVNTVEPAKEVAVPMQETPIKATSIQHTEDEIIDLLQKYKNLLDSGIITEEDFQRKKSELLNIPENNNTNH